VAVSTTKASTYDARIKDKPKLDFTLRFQVNARFQKTPAVETGLGDLALNDVDKYRAADYTLATFGQRTDANSRDARTLISIPNA
jgi:hypothetical protein